MNSIHIFLNFFSLWIFDSNIFSDFSEFSFAFWAFDSNIFLDFSEFFLNFEHFRELFSFLNFDSQFSEFFFFLNFLFFSQSFFCLRYLRPRFFFWNFEFWNLLFFSKTDLFRLCWNFCFFHQTPHVTRAWQIFFNEKQMSWNISRDMKNLTKQKKKLLLCNINYLFHGVSLLRQSKIQNTLHISWKHRTSRPLAYAITKINSFISRIFAYDIAIFKCQFVLMIVISSFCLYVMSKFEMMFKFSHKVFRHFTKHNRCMKLSSTLSNFVFVIILSTIQKHESIWFFINIVLNVKFTKTQNRDLLINDNVVKGWCISECACREFKQMKCWKCW